MNFRVKCFISQNYYVPLAIRFKLLFETKFKVVEEKKWLRESQYLKYGFISIKILRIKYSYGPFVLLFNFSLVYSLSYATNTHLTWPHTHPKSFSTINK